MNIEDISRKFDDEYMKKRHNLVWRHSIVSNAINNAIKPKTVIDFGCGCGDIVKGFLDLGIEAYGIDGSTHALDFLQFDVKYFGLFDFTKPICLTDDKVDLALCIEVFGILDHNEWDGLINNLTYHSDTLLIGLDIDKRMDIEGKLMWKSFSRKYDKEERIKEGLEQYKHKPAIKMIYHGLMIWSKNNEELTL